MFKLPKTKPVKCSLHLKKNGKRDDELKGRCSRQFNKTHLAPTIGAYKSLVKPYVLKAAKILRVFCSLKKIYGIVFSCSLYGDSELF